MALDLKDPRTIKAIEVLADCGQWLRCRSRDGRKAYGVPSQAVAGQYYFVTTLSCTCADHARRRRYDWVCKHMLAVRLHVATVCAARAGAVDVAALANNLVGRA